ncbi:MAG: hypothetical protein IH861_12855 [Chloroflexi bacterium]|nr:hypothetical protein [Chloroflexota bacterium]
MRLKIVAVASAIALVLTLVAVKFWVPTSVSAQEEAAQAIVAIMDSVNAQLAAEGADYRIAMAEYVTGEGDEAGATVISKDVGNKQLGFDFVPFDGRRAWSGPTGGPSDDITYAVDMTIDAVPPIGGLSGAATDAAIDRAMATWDGVNCSTLPITRNPDFGLDIGVVAFIFGLGGGPFIFADVQHAGWRDINFAGDILGVTFTFGFIDLSQLPDIVFTDIDNNNRLDAAWREIYYDPSFNWAVDGVTDFDVEAVALHEAGHGLSQAHFGNIFFKNDGSVKRAPAAVMNPFILGQQRSLLGTDNGGHCGNWTDWPNN